MSSIALRYGFSWQVLWNSADNRDLKQARQDPNLLFPGDIVKIPAKQTKDCACATEVRHLFKLNGFKAKLRIRLMRDDQPRAGEAYILEIDGMATQGTTDGDGWIEQKIPPNASKGKLTLSDGLETYDLQLGHLDPADQISGIEARLINLGYYAGPVSGSMTPALQAAISAYQAAKGLDQSGEADAATVAALQQEHTS